MKISPLHIILLLLCCLALPLGAQIVESATLLGHWTRDDLPGSSTYNNTFNEVWGLALNGKEYAVIGSTQGTHFIDVTVPEDAKEIAFIAGSSRGSQIIHRDYHNFGCYLYAVSDEGSGSLQIMDVSTLPDSVSVVYDQATFFTRSHNIFIDTTQAIWPTKDLQYYYLGDESHGFPLKVLDVSDRSEIEVITTFDADSPNELSIPHNQIVACDYLYVSYYYDGLQVYNISDPSRPERVSYFNTSSRTHRTSYEGAWGVYPFLPSGNILVSDMQEGLFIVSGPENNCASNEQMKLNCDFLSPVSSIKPAAFELSVFPQPANDYLQLKIEATKGQEKVNVLLLDIHGRPLQRWEEMGVSSTNLELNLPQALANGLYLLRIQIGKKYITQKVLIHQ